MLRTKVARIQVNSNLSCDHKHHGFTRGYLLVQPGVVASEIRTICSHDQALKQCRMYLKRVWPEADMLPYADTAQAAQDLGRQALDPSVAVIAPRRCAELYGLSVLAESIQDLKFNYTTFVVASAMAVTKGKGA